MKLFFAFHSKSINLIEFLPFPEFESVFKQYYFKILMLEVKYLGPLMIWQICAIYQGELIEFSSLALGSLCQTSLLDTSVSSNLIIKFFT